MHKVRGFSLYPSVHAYTSKVRARGEGLAVPCCVTADDVEGYEDLARGRNLFEYE